MTGVRKLHVRIMCTSAIATRNIREYAVHGPVATGVDSAIPECTAVVWLGDGEATRATTRQFSTYPPRYDERSLYQGTRVVSQPAGETYLTPLRDWGTASCKALPDGRLPRFLTSKFACQSGP